MGGTRYFFRVVKIDDTPGLVPSSISSESCCNREWGGVGKLDCSSSIFSDASSCSIITKDSEELDEWWVCALGDSSDGFDRHDQSRGLAFAPEKEPTWK